MDNPTAYKFCQALRKREPPIFVTDGVAKQWLQKFAQMQYVENAGHLEIRLGKRIRDDFPQEELSADTLSAWLVREHSVSVHVKVCQTWINRSWCSDCGLYTPEAVEETLGDRLRLNQYREAFCADESALHLSQVLSESQPPQTISCSILRQWYTKYHPDSGPLKYDNADNLEHAMGDSLRSVCQGLGPQLLAVVLGNARKAVLVGVRVCRSWYDKCVKKTTTASDCANGRLAGPR